MSTMCQHAGSPADEKNFLLWPFLGYIKEMGNPLVLKQVFGRAEELRRTGLESIGGGLRPKLTVNVGVLNKAVEDVLPMAYGQKLTA